MARFSVFTTAAEWSIAARGYPIWKDPANMFGPKSNPEIDAQVELCAYYTWQAEGCPAGRALDHWERARMALQGAQYLVVSYYEGGVSAQPPSTTRSTLY